MTARHSASCSAGMACRLHSSRPSWMPLASCGRVVLLWASLLHSSPALVPLEVDRRSPSAPVSLAAQHTPDVEINSLVANHSNNLCCAMRSPACQWYQSYAQPQRLQSLAVIITVLHLCQAASPQQTQNSTVLTDLRFVPQACHLWQLMA